MLKEYEVVDRETEQLKNAVFDVVIVGAGVSGAFLAWELGRRNVKVALIDQADFGSFTSASSSKLLHGGIRYLQQLKFSKVYESARERARFINFAPNLPNSIPFVVPTYNTGLMKSRLALQAGMAVYDLICTFPNSKIVDGSKKILKGFYFNKRTLLEKIPLMKGAPGLTGGQFFYEAHMHSSERMTLELVKQAKINGACVVNYTKVESFSRSQSKIDGVNCKDQISGSAFSIRAKVVVNAAGPYIPQLSKVLGEQLYKPTTGYSKGMHLVTRQLDPQYAMALVTKMKNEALVSRGGRHIFIIPWRGRSLIGTTNEPFQSADISSIPISEKEIQEFIDEINSALPKAALNREDVHYAFSGLYPLISEEVQSDTYQGTGEYQIVDHAKQGGAEGVISMMGAKFTTAGKVANKTMQMVFSKLDSVQPPQDLFSEATEQWQAASCDDLLCQLQQKDLEVLPAETIVHLVTNYGFSAEDIIRRVKLAPEMGEKLAVARENILAELYYCVEEERVCHLDDFIFRRTGLGTIGHPGNDCLKRCAKVLGDYKGWSDDDVANELDRVESRYCYDG